MTCHYSASKVEYTVASNAPELYTPLIEPLGAKSVKKDFTAGALESNCHLAVGADVLQTPAVTSLADSVKVGGFVLLEEGSDVTESAVKRTGLELVAKIKAERRVYFLLRKVGTGKPACEHILELQKPLGLTFCNHKLF